MNCGNRARFLCLCLSSCLGLHLLPGGHPVVLGQAKVDDFDRGVRVAVLQQEVLRFDVPVHKVVVMQIASRDSLREGLEAKREAIWLYI